MKPLMQIFRWVDKQIVDRLKLKVLDSKAVEYFQKRSKRHQRIELNMVRAINAQLDAEGQDVNFDALKSFCRAAKREKWVNAATIDSLIQRINDKQQAES
jgi:hypothetical protein